METVTDFILGGSKITADGDCSHEIKRDLILGRKPMTNLDSILKSRDITLPTQVHLVKAMVFPVVRYGYESWTVKEAERRRIDAFELWCWSPLDCKETPTPQFKSSKVMSLLFNILSRLIVFLPRSKRLLSSWLQLLSAMILEPKNIKSVTVSIVSLPICHEVIGPDAMIFIF